MPGNIFRKHVRLPAENYFVGYYFVTIVTRGRQALLVGDSAEALRSVAAQLPMRFPGWFVDTLEIMPDHAHLILVSEVRGVSLGRVVGAIKSLFWRWRMENGLPEPVWQPSFYDRIIRTERELNAVRVYIRGNPYEAEIDWRKVPQLD